MRTGEKTDIGLVRKVNEDALFVGSNLLVVADGMGGHAAGEVASQLAVATLVNWHDWSIPFTAMHDAVSAANEAVIKKASDNLAYVGMGTTLTACYVRSKRLWTAHVGDSRLYQYRQGELTCLTNDHSVVGELLRTGAISKDEARVHPQRNILTRALGTTRRLAVDVFEMEIEPDDRYLLCTDGLYGVVSEAEVSNILHKYADPNKASVELVRAANAAGGPDNITVVVADVTKEELT